MLKKGGWDAEIRTFHTCTTAKRGQERYAEHRHTSCLQRAAIPITRYVSNIPIRERLGSVRALDAASGVPCWEKNTYGQARDARTLQMQRQVSHMLKTRVLWRVLFWSPTTKNVRFWTTLAFNTGIRIDELIFSFSKRKINEAMKRDFCVATSHAILSNLGTSSRSLFSNLHLVSSFQFSPRTYMRFPRFQTSQNKIHSQLLFQIDLVTFFATKVLHCWLSGRFARQSPTCMDSQWTFCDEYQENRK